MPSIVQQLLGEARPTNAFSLVGKIGKIPGYEKVDIWSQADGYSILLRETEGPYAGQAYEVQIRPAAYAKHPSMKELYGTGRGTAHKKTPPAQAPAQPPAAES